MIYVFAFTRSVAVERDNLPIRGAIYLCKFQSKLVEIVFSAIFSPSIEASVASSVIGDQSLPYFSIRTIRVVFFKSTRKQMVRSKRISLSIFSIDISGLSNSTRSAGACVEARPYLVRKGDRSFSFDLYIRRPKKKKCNPYANLHESDSFVVNVIRRKREKRREEVKRQKAGRMNPIRRRRSYDQQGKSSETRFKWNTWARTDLQKHLSPLSLSLCVRVSDSDSEQSEPQI